MKKKFVVYRLKEEVVLKNVIENLLNNLPHLSPHLYNIVGEFDNDDDLNDAICAYQVHEFDLLYNFETLTCALIKTIKKTTIVEMFGVILWGEDTSQILPNFSLN